MGRLAVFGISACAGCSDLLESEADFQIIEKREGIISSTKTTTQGKLQYIIGEEVEFEVLVRNEGLKEGTQNVVLEAGGEPIASEELVIPEGEEETVVFPTKIDSLDTGTYVYIFKTNDDSFTAGEITVEPRERYIDIQISTEDSGIQIERFDEPKKNLQLRRTDTNISIILTINNHGEIEGSEEVALFLSGEKILEESITLSGGEQVSISEDINTEDLESGSYEFEGVVGDESVTGEFTVLEIGGSIEQELEDVVDSNGYVDELLNIDVAEGEGGYEAEVRYETQFLTSKSPDEAERELNRRATRVFEDIFTGIPDLAVVELTTAVPTVDEYGNEELTDVHKVELKEETVERIDWGGFRFENLQTIADSYAFYPFPFV